MESYIRLSKVTQFIGLKKHVLRKWIERLEPLASRPTKERSATEFNAADLLFLEVVRILIDEAGMDLESVAEFSVRLYEVLQRPWALNLEKSLVISRSLGGSWRLDDQSTPPFVLIEVPLDAARMKVFQTLGVSSDWQQGELRLGLMAANINQRRGT